ncbi:hypothetical protein V498_03523 [Pseudogymnoascus sp. VKM F-4517 (FW-2822)]|nr:hypothetical protein V498_03523 [Pseudogymnoascus sp. VKM F-4517 (FW-2822)]
MTTPQSYKAFRRGTGNGKYQTLVIDSGIPVSDRAAEVVALGTEVHDFAIGDCVALIFNLMVDGTEAACITCARTTAWNALCMPRSKGTALTQGT